jgi:magnesium-transporting ATPase (P-type)
LTDFDQTHCFSTHLTTFAGGFLALPAPINWNYVFANGDFMKNKTIYLTVITIAVLYIILIIIARLSDSKDRDKVWQQRPSSIHSVMSTLSRL